MKKRSRAVAVAGLLLAMTSLLAGEEKNPGRATGVEIVKNEAARRVDVRIGGKPFTSYIWPESLTKPVLYPLLTAKGTAVTRGFPLDPRPGERTDHPHHVGLFLSYGDVNGVDFWNNSSALPAEQQAKMGRHRQVKVTEAQGGPREGRLRVATEWVMPDGTVALDEDTTFLFRGDGASRIVDRSSRLTARVPVTFADNKEGFLGLRLARALEHPTKEAATFTDAQGRPTTVAVLDNAGVTGLYHSSEGKEGDAVWGTRGRWVALSGRLGDEDVTLTILDDPKNPGAPTYWHARGYGLFAANTLGQKVFSNGKEELNLKLAAGASATFHYRVIVSSKAFAAPAVEALYKEMVR
jgi:Methane oxygenase PmoA